MMTMPAINNVVSRYLFNTDTPPSNLTNESIIRNEGQQGDRISVDANEYMTTGGGRFAGVERFNFVRNFLASNDYKGILPAGVYTTSELLVAYGITDNLLAVQQYYQGVYDSDYAQRAYVFGSGNYKINDDALFYVNENGTREISNICVVPVDNDFDYESTNWLASFTNYLTEGEIDPSGIGRTVPIHFSGTVTQRYSFTGEDWYTLDIRNQQAQVDELAAKAALATNLAHFAGLFGSVLTGLVGSNVITYEDSNGRFVVYDGKDKNNSNSNLDAISLLNLTEQLPYNGVVVIAGSGDDHLYGTGYSAGDELWGGAGNDTLDGRLGGDKLIGGAGDDTYVVEDDEDIVVEEADGGEDTVKSEIDYTIGAYVENLELTGDGSISGIGNSYKNKIRGNGSSNNIIGLEGDDNLYGEGGSDFLDGGQGRDLLVGGADADRLEGGEDFDLYQADNLDTIVDSDGVGGVFLDGFRLAGGARTEDDPENTYYGSGDTYVLNGTTLKVNGGLTIEQFSNGDLGIFLDTEPDDDEEETPDTSDAEQRTSPIVIDLDGDGVETLGLTRYRYFDHDANGMQERTAWAGSDDGFLVRDLNGNGRIDNGLEMFGNHTLLSAGGVAANGFQALRDIDGNQDGRLDANDAAFAQLRIWRDANSNGVTDAGELLTLEQAGISAVRTQWQASTFVDTNGQAHGQIGSAVRTDGSDAAAADVWFEVDAAHRINVQPIVFSPDLVDLPEAKGFGNLVDLIQAMASDSVLRGLVEDFAAATDPVARDAMLEGLIFQWAGVANVDPNSRDPRMVYGHVMDARQLIVLEQLVGRGYEGTWCWGERDPNPHGAAAPLLIAEFKEFQQYVRAQLLAQIDPGSYTFIKGGFGSGYSSVKIDWVAFQQAAGALRNSGDVDKLTEIIGVVRDLGTYSPLFRTRTAQAFADLQATYPDLAPLFDTASLIGTIGNDNLFGGLQGEVIVADKGDDTLYGGGGNDSYYYRVGDGKDRIYDSSGVDQLVFMNGIVASDVTVGRDLTSILILVTVGATLGEIRIDNVFDENGHLREGVIESIKFQDGTIWTLQDMLSRIVLPITQGDDVLYGSIVADTISAQGGNDRLLGLDGNDQLNGEAGNDIIVGGNGNDVLDGGSGNDQLNGGAGNDTYLFAAGFGQDVIENYDDQTQRLDRIVFAAGIGPGDVTLTRSGDDLLLSLANGDSMRVRSHYNGDGNSRYSINEVHFADGTVWNAATLNSMALGGTTGNDTLTGYESDDIVLGLGGNDNISGGAGNDQLSGNEGDDRLSGDNGNDHLIGGAGLDQLLGGDGDDVLDGGADRDFLSGGYGADQLSGGDADDSLYGDAGDDQLVGGLGNDRLEGGYGDDRYYFARGDGTDTISDVGGQSTIYVSNLPLAEVYFRRDGSSLVIRFTSSANDEIRLERFFDPVTGLALSGIRIDSGNGQPWDIASNALDAEVLKATNLDDVINGNLLDNVIDGLAGNDVIRGHDGVDQISGGTGDDTLYGDAGNDILNGNDGNDQLQGGAGEDVLQGGVGNDTLDGGEAADSLVGGSGDDLYRVDSVIDTVIEAIGEGDDSIESTVSFTLPTNVETLRLIGDANINATGGTGNDHLIGNAGSNSLIGGAGNDVLNGAAGADTLAGGVGNDTYVVDRSDDFVTELMGEGYDTVEAASDYTLSNNVEKLILTNWANTGTGNGLDNVLVGNAAGNRLDGGTGADHMSGGEGDDTYVVDTADDVIVEQEGEGNDTV